ncbi:unnamed protein product [Boreogadus saida]
MQPRKTRRCSHALASVPVLPKTGIKWNDFPVNAASRLSLFRNVMQEAGATAASQGLGDRVGGQRGLCLLLQECVAVPERTSSHIRA